MPSKTEEHHQPKPGKRPHADPERQIDQIRGQTAKRACHLVAEGDVLRGDDLDRRVELRGLFRHTPIIHGKSVRINQGQPRPRLVCFSANSLCLGSNALIDDTDLSPLAGPPLYALDGIVHTGFFTCAF